MRSRIVGRAVATFFGLIGLSLFLAPVVSAESRADGGAVFLPLVGLFMVGAAAVVWVIRGTAPNGRRRTSLMQQVDGPALEVRLRPTTPLVMVTLGLTTMPLFILGILAVGIGDGGLLFVPFALLFLVLVPDAARAMVNKPALVIGLRSVVYRGWTIDSELAWDDVESVQLDTSDSQGARVAVTGRFGAASWKVVSRRLLIPLDPFPGLPEIRVLVAALDEPERVQVLMGNLARVPPAERIEFFDQDMVLFLSGETGAQEQ